MLGFTGRLPLNRKILSDINTVRFDFIIDSSIIEEIIASDTIISNIDFIVKSNYIEEIVSVGKPIDFIIETNLDVEIPQKQWLNVFNINLLTNQSLNKKVIFNNAGDVNVYPIMEFQKYKQLNDAIIKNLNTGQIFAMHNLIHNEIIAVDNENELIISNLNLVRYNNHNNEFLYMAPGKNEIQVVGIIYLKFKWQFKSWYKI